MMNVNDKRHGSIAKAETEGIRAQGVDAVTVNRTVLVAFGFIATVVLAGWAIKTGSMSLMLGVVALPFVLILMNRPDIAFVMAFLMDATGMAIPGITYTSLGLLAKVVVVATAVFALLLRNRNPGANAERMREAKPLKWMVAIILMLMAVRGTGLRALGSASWGGMSYIVLLLGIFFYFSVQNVRLSGRQIRWLLWGMAIAGLIGSQFERLGWERATTGSSESVQSRLQWLMTFVNAGFPLVFVLRLKTWMRVAFWLAMLFLVGLTGFRSKLVELLMITAAFNFFITKRRVRYVVTCMLAGLVLWIGVIALSPFVPLGIQRTISFVPGVNIEQSAAKNAFGSIEWRVEIWRYCIERSNDYLLIGRGSAFDVSETVAGLGVSDIATYSPFFAYETRSYHSGPLSLLIDYGVPGFLVATWLVVVLFKRFWKYAAILGTHNKLEARFALYACSFMLWQFVAFYLVYGSMIKFSNTIIAMSSFALVLSRSFMHRADVLVETTQKSSSCGIK